MNRLDFLRRLLFVPALVKVKPPESEDPLAWAMGVDYSTPQCRECLFYLSVEVDPSFHIIRGRPAKLLLYEWHPDRCSRSPKNGTIHDVTDRRR